MRAVLCSLTGMKIELDLEKIYPDCMRPYTEVAKDLAMAWEESGWISAAVAIEAQIPKPPSYPELAEAVKAYCETLGTPEGNINQTAYARLYAVYSRI